MMIQRSAQLPHAAKHGLDAYWQIFGLSLPCISVFATRYANACNLCFTMAHLEICLLIIRSVH